jgi:hypothetical protein
VEAIKIRSRCGVNQHHTGGGMINAKLISHPMNWVIVLLMLAIAGIFGHLLLSVLDQEPMGVHSASSLPAGLV